MCIFIHDVIRYTHFACADGLRNLETLIGQVEDQVDSFKGNFEIKLRLCFPSPDKSSNLLLFRRG